MKWQVIINPTSNGGKAKLLWPEIQQELIQQDFEFDYSISSRPNEIIDLVKKLAENGFSHFIIVGGDGSLHEAINGVFKQNTIKTNNIVFGHIPVGTGNDWGKMYSNPTDFKEAIKIIKKDIRIVQDIGYLIFPDSPDTNRYFINIAGFGFDAQVLKSVLKQKEKGKNGTLIYLVKLFTNLIGSGYYRIEYNNDKGSYQSEIFNMAAGICRFNGNGMQPLPLANPTDGLLDVSIVRKISKIRVLWNVNRLFKGTYIKIKKVDFFRTKSFWIKSHKPMPVEADGEFLGYTPVQIEIIPQSLQMIVNQKKFSINPKIIKYVPGTFQI